MEKYAQLRKAIENVKAIDAHAHNLVALDSNFDFRRCFSEAEGDALDFAVHTLSFKRSIRDIAELYKCDASLDGIERHRKSNGLHSTGLKCFKAANLSAILVDDGIIFDKMHDLEWHKCMVPIVGRILRIERLAEIILNEEVLKKSKISLETFSETFVTKMKLYPLQYFNKIFFSFVICSLPPLLNS